MIEVVDGKSEGRSFYGFGKVLMTMESWDHSRAAVEPTLAAARAESMPFTAMPRVRTWKGAGAFVSEAYLDSALWSSLG